MSFERARVCDLAALTVVGAVWVAMILCVNPAGDFPLNDDWVYAGAVKSIVAGSGFHIPGPTIANLIVQAYWGALFCLPFGFSYIALHVSTLVLGLAGLAFFYGSVREMGGSRPIALFATLTLAVDPLFFDLANSFMTDVPFVSLMAIATYAFIRGLRRPSLSWLVVGIVGAMVTILLRQVGIALLLAFAVAWPVRRGVSSLSVLTGIVLVCLGVRLALRLSALADRHQPCGGGDGGGAGYAAPVARGLRREVRPLFGLCPALCRRGFGYPM